MAHGLTQLDFLAPRAIFHHRPIARICGDLPAWDSRLTDTELLAFANARMVERPGDTPQAQVREPGGDAGRAPDHSAGIPAGYTYFGQFVEHDITFDPAASGMRAHEPGGLSGGRAPRLDLDTLYGAGPDDQPYLYDPTDSAKMAIGEVMGAPGLPDLPRFQGRALIGDMRNDGIAMVSQLQLAFLLAHNTLVDRARAADPRADTRALFERARTTLRWLYQYIVWFDFLPRVLTGDIHACALRRQEVCGGRQVWTCGLGDVWDEKSQPGIPVEFSAAAYRFGHSMMRNGYQTNGCAQGGGKATPVFDDSGLGTADDLRGFRPITPDTAIQWDWFLPMQSSGTRFPQMARRIATRLAPALADMHEGPENAAMNDLAFRTLKHGIACGLPGGTAVARKFSVAPIRLETAEPDALWFYILREAEATDGTGLGRVGSIIVAAVFAGLLKADPSSWISRDPGWTPAGDALLRDGEDDRDDPGWTLASIIRLAGIKADGIGFEPRGSAP
ncbi:peroxidase family protein [Roseivivax sp. CAU 1753]